MNPLHVEIYESPEAVVIRLEGEAGLAAAEGIQAPLSLVVARRPAVVILDLADLLFATSLFLGTMVGFRRGIVRQGGRVKIVGLTERMRGILTSTRLIDLFEVVEPVSPSAGAPATNGAPLAAP
jgi:anti-anti-sigma factor